MSKILIFQPHFDDAVWSIAEHMLTWKSQGHDLAVVTAFGWAGADKELTMSAEHAQAMQLMGNIFHWSLDFKDDAHADREFDHNEFSRAVHEEVNAERPDVVVMPSGIYHPDHLALARVRIPGRVWRYDELPYYVLYPVLTRPWAATDWVMQGLDDHFVFKKSLCQQYASQWAPHLERTVFAPERLWVPA